MSKQTSDVINSILEYIRFNNLQPGDPMPSEPVLKERLGVSRATLREGMRELRTLRIVEVRHGLGSFVGEGSLCFLSDALVFRMLAPGNDPLEGISELVAVREILEVGMAEQIAGHLDDDQIHRLEKLITQMDDDDDFGLADRRFHAVLYEKVNNAIAVQLINAFWDAFDTIKSRLPQAQGGPSTREVHRQILVAYSGDDIEKAQEAMKNHFSFIKQRIETAIHAENA